jgi:hypothetical protein
MLCFVDFENLSYVNSTSAWFLSFKLYANETNLNVSSKEAFLSHLPNFLKLNPIFRQDLNYSMDEIHASRFFVQTLNTATKKETLLGLRRAAEHCMVELLVARGSAEGASWGMNMDELRFSADSDPHVAAPVGPEKDRGDGSCGDPDTGGVRMQNLMAWVPPPSSCCCCVGGSSLTSHTPFWWAGALSKYPLCRTWSKLSFSALSGETGQDLCWGPATQGNTKKQNRAMVSFPYRWMDSNCMIVFLRLVIIGLAKQSVVLYTPQCCQSSITPNRISTVGHS